MNFGLFGYGDWGRRVARSIARVGRLAVIAEPAPERMLEAGAEWSAWGTQVVSDPRFALDMCDAVWVATPVTTHYDLAKLALEAGKHVMCEKPFVLHAPQAQYLATRAEESGLALMVGHLGLYTAQHDAALAVSNPTDIRAVRRTVRPSISDHDVLWGLGPHDIACIHEIFGDPERVIATGTQHRVFAMLGFTDGRSATVELDWLAEERHREFSINHGVNLAANPNMSEPLLREAKAFAHLCRHDGGREAKRAEAVGVTWILDQISRVIDSELIAA